MSFLIAGETALSSGQLFTVAQNSIKTTQTLSDALPVSNFPTVQFVLFFYVLLLNTHAQLSFDYKKCFSSSFFILVFLCKIKMHGSDIEAL